jgi:hypothetical protein
MLYPKSFQLGQPDIDIMEVRPLEEEAAHCDGAGQELSGEVADLFEQGIGPR